MPRLPTDQQQSYCHLSLHHTETLDTAKVPGHPQVRPPTTLCYHVPDQAYSPAFHQHHSSISVHLLLQADSTYPLNLPALAQPCPHAVGKSCFLIHHPALRQPKLTSCHSNF